MFVERFLEHAGLHSTYQMQSAAIDQGDAASGVRDLQGTDAAVSVRRLMFQEHRARPLGGAFHDDAAEMELGLTSGVQHLQVCPCRTTSAT